MPEGVTPEPEPSAIDDLRRRLADATDLVRDLRREAKEHRLARNKYKSRVEELEAARPSEPSQEIETLRRENRTLKHRGVFERVAREAGVRTSGKALDILWDALKYAPDGEADPADLKGKIEAVRADYDFLFDAAAGETPKPTGPADELNRAMQPAKPETPAKPAGPGGSGRGAPADGSGAVKVRKSDLQSFDPRINPMMDRNRARQIEQAKKDGKLVYVDE